MGWVFLLKLFSGHIVVLSGVFVGLRFYVRNQSGSMLNLRGFFSKLKTLLVMMFVLVSVAVNAQQDGEVDDTSSAREALMLQLREAKSIVAYRPEKALDILQKHQAQLSTLRIKEQIDWQLTMATVALELGDTNMLEKQLLSVSPFIGGKDLADNEQKVIAYVGHYFILLSRYENARRAYLCALTKNGNTTEKIALLYSLAVLFSKSGDNEQARFVFLVLLNHVEGKGDLIHQARLENALGVIGLELGQYLDASERFKKAMELHQVSAKRSGQVNASLNLLLTYVLQKDFVKFQRLKPRIKLLLDDFPDKSKQLYLEFIVAAYKVSSGEGISKQQRQVLTEAFHMLNNAMVRDAITKYLLDIVDVSHSQPTVLEKMSQQSKLSLGQFPVCDWHALDDQQVMRSLSDLLK